jgi:hypothetical protein
MFDAYATNPNHTGIKVFAYIIAFIISVSVYIRLKKREVDWYSTFWGLVLVVCAVSSLLYENQMISGYKGLFQFCAAVYFVLCFSEYTIAQSGGRFILFDMLNAGILIPFGNFSLHMKALRNVKVLKKSSVAKQVLGGLAAALLLIIFVTPMLFNADTGSFGKFVSSFITSPFIGVYLPAEILYLILSVPTIAYLYGLCCGSANHIHSEKLIDSEKVEKISNTLQFFSVVTAAMALIGLLLWYAVFFVTQTVDYVQALSGTGTIVYSAFARSGFFDLTGIAVLNLVLITAQDTFVKRSSGKKHLVLRIVSVLLCLVTLMFIALAIWKMGLYIVRFGLTDLRLIPSIFMIYLTVIFVLLIVKQFKDINISKIALYLGAVIMCLIMASNFDKLVIRYNTNAYLSGTLEDYDTSVLERSGLAGLEDGIRVYKASNDAEQKTKLESYFWYMSYEVYGRNVTTSFEARKAIKLLDELKTLGVNLWTE